DTSGAATSLQGAGDWLTYGDVASASDTDWYSFTAVAGGTGTVGLHVSGVSLLAGRVTVFDSQMERIKCAAAGAFGQDLTLSLYGLVAGSNYFVRVDEVPGTAFAAGQYSLRVDIGAAGPEVLTLGGQPPVDDEGTNESFLFATRLGNVATNGGTEYRVFSHLRANDVGVYRVPAPGPGVNQANGFTAAVPGFRGLGPAVPSSNPPGLPVS